jgi:hypothetical protein
MTTNPPQQQELGPQSQPVANPPAAAPLGNKYSAANDMMFEDCLKSILLKSKTGKSYSSYKNKLCPKAKQSPFGDFPPEYFSKKPMNVSPEPSVTGMSTASATTMHSKCVYINNAQRR